MQLAGPVHEKVQPLTIQSVRYHSLSGRIGFSLQESYVSATSQDRLHGVFGRMSIYETFFIRHAKKE